MVSGGDVTSHQEPWRTLKDISIRERVVKCSLGVDTSRIAMERYPSEGV